MTAAKVTQTANAAWMWDLTLAALTNLKSRRHISEVNRGMGQGSALNAQPQKMLGKAHKWAFQWQIRAA